MGRFHLISIGCGLLTAQLAAQAASKTFFEERLLDRAPIIVRARYDADQSCFDVDVAAFKVVHALRGEADPRILVLGAIQLTQRGRDIERLLFLKREPSGCFYRIVDMIDLVEEPGATEAFVRAFLVVANEEEPIKRRAGLKQVIMDGLAMKAEFPRKLAARELERLARRVPPVLTVDELAEIAKFQTMASPEDAARIQQAIEAAENAILRQFAGTQNAFPRGPKRNQYVRSVADFFRDPDPLRQEAAADHVALRFGDAAVPFLMKVLDDDEIAARAMLHLGALQCTAAAPRLIEMLAPGARDPGPAIEALGEIGAEAAVPAVSRYLSSGDHFDAAALALVRINTASAKRILEGVQAQLRRDVRQQPRIEMLDRIRTREFLEEDIERRIGARGRYPRE